MPQLSDHDYCGIIKLLTLAKPIPVKTRSKRDKRLYKKISGYRLVAAKTRDYTGKRSLRVMRNGRIVLPVSEVRQCISTFYQKSKGDGARKLAYTMKDMYYGLGERTIQRHLNAFPEQQRRRPKFINKAPLRPIQARDINERHQIDLVDFSNTISSSKEGKGHRYVVSILDGFSRYLWLRAIPDKKSATVAGVVKGLYAEWGKPRIIQCDQGTEFRGSFEELAKEMGIKIVRSSPYYPQSQGKCERSHQTWKAKLYFDILKNEGTKKWSERLQEYGQLYNEAYHTAIRMTPFQCHFQRDTPSRENAAASSHLAATKMVQRHLSKHPPAVYQVNEVVWLKPSKQEVRKRSSRCTSVKARITKADPEGLRYKVSIEDTEKEEWVSVRRLTSEIYSEEKRKHTAATKQKKVVFLHKLKSLATSSGIPDELKRRAALYGLKMQSQNPGGGNCMFHALSQQLALVGMSLDDGTIRQQIVDHMAQHPVIPAPDADIDIRNFVDDENFPSYLDRMRNDGEWGDHLVLLTAARLYGVSITVISSTSIEPVYIRHDIPVQSPQPLGTYFLAILEKSITSA